MQYIPRPELYDVVYSFKDYEEEARRIVELVDERVPHARTLLDVGCGTGRHLELLSRRFACEGVDLDEALLEIARRRLPKVPLHAGDMRSFQLGRRFDVVTCLFSAIGYMVDLDSLAAAARTLAGHLADGGLLLVEPWITPEAWVPGQPHALAADGTDLAVARVSLSGRAGRVSTIEMRYLVGTPDGIEALEERHELGLFSLDEMRAALESAGLTAEHQQEGLIGRGFWLATRPATGPATAR